MKYILLFSLLMPGTVLAQEIELNGDYGCISPDSHKDRVSLLKQRMATTDIDLQKEYDRKIVQISKFDCTPLNGKFKVIKQIKDYTEVQTKEEKLWVMR